LLASRDDSYCKLLDIHLDFTNLGSWPVSQSAALL
jgi:hypothetical protein